MALDHAEDPLLITPQASYCMVMAILAIQAMRVKPEYSALRSLGQLFCAIYVSFISFDRYAKY